MLLAAVLFALSRLAAADPTVELGRILEDAGYQRVSITTAAAPAGQARLRIRYDPARQAPAAVEVLSLRAAELAWTRGRIAAASVSVEPRGGAAIDRSAAELATVGAPPLDRQSHASIDRRAGRVVALAAVAVLLTAVLVVLASGAAFRVARRRRPTRPPPRT